MNVDSDITIDIYINVDNIYIYILILFISHPRLSSAAGTLRRVVSEPEACGSCCQCIYIYIYICIHLLCIYRYMIHYYCNLI